MRKSTMFMLIIGTLLIGLGITGIIFYDSPSEMDLSYDFNQTFAFNGEELSIKDLPKNTSYEITLVQHNSNKIKLSGTLNTLQTKDAPKLTLKDHTLSIQSTNLRKNNDFPRFLRAFLITRHFYQRPLRLEIPTTVKKITLDNASFSLYKFKAEELTLKNQKQYQNISDSHIKKLNVIGENSLNLKNTRIDTLNAATTGHELLIFNSYVHHILFNTTDTFVQLDNVKVKEAKGNVEGNNVQLNNVSGNFTLTGTPSFVQLGENIKGNLDISLTSGSITDYSNIAKPTKTKISASAELGELDLYNSHKNIYGPQNAMYEWRLKTEMGNIKMTAENTETDDEKNHTHQMNSNHYEDTMNDVMETDDYNED